MALHFLTDDAATAGVGDAVELTGVEAKHAAVVRRVRVGEEVTLGDGAGAWLTGAAESVAPERVVVRIAARREEPAPSPRILLAQALAKGDRDEMAVQAACELGVDGVIPWQAARSVSRWEGKKAAKGRERWASIVREAAKQAHRAWVPDVAEAETTAQLVARCATQRLVLLDPTASAPLGAFTGDVRDVVLVVGPEGGFTTEEIERLESAGAERAVLGSHVLRTSTAGPAAIAVLSVALGRW